MKRLGLSIIPLTRVPKGMPVQYNIDILVFQKFVIAARKREILC
jgi:hypothetical protein